MQTPRDKLKHPKALGARMASKQGVPGQDLSHNTFAVAWILFMSGPTTLPKYILDDTRAYSVSQREPSDNGLPIHSLASLHKHPVYMSLGTVLSWQVEGKTLTVMLMCALYSYCPIFSRT